MVDDAATIVESLDRLGADVAISDDALRVRLPGGTVSPELAAAIRAHKPAVIAEIVSRSDAGALAAVDTALGKDRTEPDPPASRRRGSGGALRPDRQQARPLPAGCIARRHACPVLGPCDRHRAGRPCLVPASSEEAA